MIASFLAAALLALAPASSPPDGAAVPARSDPAPRLQRGYLRVDGIDRAALVEALVLRVPELPLQPFEAATEADPDAPVAFIDVRPEPSATPEAPALALTIVVSDGRAFDRRIDLPPDEQEPTRVVASTIANLLLAIEAGTVKADRDDVPLPTPDPVPAAVCPEPPACPVVTEHEEPTAKPETAEPDAPPPRWEWGASASGLTTLGLGAPASADRYAAAGANVGLHFRLRRGLTVLAEARGSGRGEPAGTSLARLRIAVGAGYQWRARDFVVGGSLLATVEPWWLRGAPIDPPPRPLWGLAVRLSPAWHRDRVLGSRFGLDVGPTLELAASASLSGDGPTVQLIVIRELGQEQRRLRAGGLELTLGLGATLWLPGPSSRR